MSTVQHCLEVSTAHLSRAERDRLLPADAGGQLFVGPLSVYRIVDSVGAAAFALIMDEEDRAWREDWPTLAAVTDKATELGTTMFLIHPDVDTVDGLAVHQ